jgi:hypothetical protein
MVREARRGLHFSLKYGNGRISPQSINFSAEPFR